MRAKIGDKWYSSDDYPIMIELTDEDKGNISRMPKAAHRYCSYPDSILPEVIEKWMVDI